MAIERISDAFTLHKKLQQIENKIETTPITPKACQRIFKQLEGLQGGYERVQSVYAHRSRLFAQDSEKIVYLFGRVVDKKVDYEVEEIAKETAVLELSLGSEKPLELSEKMVVLQKKINSLLYRHRLSKDHLPVIERAEALLASAQKDVSPPLPMRHFEFVAMQRPAAQVEAEEAYMLMEEVAEIFELARSVYDKDLKQRYQYAQLSSHLKRAVARHLEHLGKEVFADSLSTLQALFATSYEIAGRPVRYPSKEEISSFFSECEEVCKQDKEKILSILFS